MDESVAVNEATLEARTSSEINSPSGASETARLTNGPQEEKKTSKQKIQPIVQKRSMPRVRAGGGPRTAIGKERSRGNAVKHGIFARGTVLEGESFKQFDSVLQGLRNDFQPAGTLENMLVEKLASLAWRYRRMLSTEKAEIRLGMSHNSLNAEQDRLYRQEALALFASCERAGPGLHSKWENPFIRERCIELLKALETSIKIRCFDPSYDEFILKMILGEGIPSELRMIYSLLSKQSTLREELKEFDLPPEGRKAKFLEILAEVIDRWEHLSKVTKDMAAMRERMVTRCSGVPEATRLDRMLRYEAALERAFDRTLSQLERLQRNRRGQFVPPEQQLRVTLEP